MIKNVKKGSVLVMTAMLISAMIPVMGIFFFHTKEKAIDGSVHALLNLWNQSVMGEYNRDLLQAYGIYGYRGYDKKVKDKLRDYMDYSFKDSENIKVEGVKILLRNHRLADYEKFKKQLVELGQITLAGDLSSKIGIGKRQEKKIIDRLEESNRYIINEEVLQYLPSYGHFGSFSFSEVKNLKSIDNIAKRGSDAYFIHKYIFQYLEEEDGYFKFAPEYVICGNKSDTDNLNGVKWRIIGIREIFNAIYLYNSPDKISAIVAAAQIISPGIGGEAAKHGIVATWAYLESTNDYKLLIKGKKVPLFKDDISWATEPKHVIERIFGILIDKDNKNGNTYDDYLKLLLFLTDERTKVLRIMDLIQINMQFRFDKDFMLEEHFNGITSVIKINGRVHEVKKEYY